MFLNNEKKERVADTARRMVMKRKIAQADVDQLNNKDTLLPEGEISDSIQSQ
jgi:hypothetical protein